MTEVLRIENLHKSFGDLEVLKGIDLIVQKSETIVILGASGSGKSTLLRCVNFMEIPSSGRIVFQGNPVGSIGAGGGNGGSVSYAEKELTALRARVGMVFQHFNLFPHMNVMENVMEGPRTVLKCERDECIRRADKYLDKVGLGWKAEAYPSQLSGGQQTFIKYKFKQLR